MDYTTIRIRTKDYKRLKLLADKDERTIVWYMSKLLDTLSESQILTSDPVQDYKPKLKTRQKSTTHPYFAEMKQIYMDTWKANNHFDYTDWNSVQAIALNSIIKKLESLNDGSKNLTDLFSVLMNKLPEFYKKHNLSSINKNLNGIIAEIKQGGIKPVKNIGKFDYRN